MNFSDITFARLQAQQISDAQFTTPGDLVNHLGAVQSQDFNMALWGLGVRLPQSTFKTIEDAINRGQILRTHVLRPTWHFVTPADIGWMLDLSSKSLRSSIGARDRQLGLSTKVYQRVNKLIVKSLEENGPRTRDELMAILKQAGIETSENRSSHLLFSAEIDKLICSGPMKNGKVTYALFSEQVPAFKTLTREEGLAKLALKYFNSHGPATIKDLSWWGGINQRDARAGAEANKNKLVHEKIGDEIYWMPHDLRIRPHKEKVYLLPAYDEFTISYKDRTASLDEKHRKKIISINGIFNPLIIVKGRVAGMWKRLTAKEKMTITLNWFSKPDKKILGLAEKEAEKYAGFVGKDLQVT